MKVFCPGVPDRTLEMGDLPLSLYTWGGYSSAFTAPYCNHLPSRCLCRPVGLREWGWGPHVPDTVCDIFFVG